MLCEQNYAAELYKRVVQLFDSYLVQHLDRLVAACKWSGFESFLTNLNCFWTDYCEQLVSFFIYM